MKQRVKDVEVPPNRIPVIHNDAWSCAVKFTRVWIEVEQVQIMYAGETAYGCPTWNHKEE